MDAAPLRLSTHTGVRRIKSRVHDDELRTDKIIGNGWTWECSAGHKGSWEATREKALHSLKEHKRLVHGER